jgi:hypothetical protein
MHMCFPGMHACHIQVGKFKCFVIEKRSSVSVEGSCFDAKEQEMWAMHVSVLE